MYNFKNIPDLTGKIAIVTGANSGTGYGATYHLAKHNCKVIMASRNQQKLEKAREELLKEVPHANLEIEVVDITDMTSIKAFTDRIKAKYQKIDFLVNNAGGGSQNFTMTKDNLETVLTVNYFGHFALTVQLLPVLKDSSKTVIFSSIGYKRFMKNDLDTENLMCTNAADFNQMEEYCKGKLCSILFSVQLQREFEKIGSTSKSFACHPGFARTNLMSQSGFSFRGMMLNAISALLRQSHDLYAGALPAIEAIIADDAKPGVVYSPSSKSEFVGNPIPREIDRTHFREEDIEKLWHKTQEILGIKVSDYMHS